MRLTRAAFYENRLCSAQYAGLYRRFILRGKRVYITPGISLISTSAVRCSG